MIINFFRWLFGYVVFSFSGGFTAGFLNECYNSSVNINEVAQTENGIIAKCDIKTYFRLHSIALRHGGKVKIIKRRGVPFLLSPLRNRFGVFFGVLFMVLFVSFMGGFIWNVTVVGNNRVTDAQIVDYLAHNGFKTGARWSQTDKENLEFGVMAEFDEVSWISINKLGCLALIEINETIDKPSIVDDSKITNVVAAEDGVITHITSLGGWNVAAVGDAVVKGDLLISGINESEVDKKNHFAHAHGTVHANVSGEIRLNISREQKKKDFFRHTEHKALYFFGITLPLDFNNDKGAFDEQVQKSYLVYNDFRLPVGIIASSRDYYNVISRELDDNELRALAESELEREKQSQLGEVQLVSESTELNTNDDGCEAVFKYSCIKNIAVEREISFNEQ